MKWFVGVLVTVNVLLFAYFKVTQQAPKTELASPEIAADKLKVLSAKELEAMPQKVISAPAEPAAPIVQVEAGTCYKWGDFTSTNLPAAQVVLVKLGLQAETLPSVDGSQDRRFWVYYPPLKSAELAQAKADEIKALGVDDLYIVQDSQWRNAISFGLFADEQLASRLLSDLQAKGVRGATKALRNPGKTLTTLLIRGVTANHALELQKIKPEFVGTELSPSAC